jgi:hypothetical protein
MREDQELRQRCAALVAELELPPVCGLEEFSAAVQARLGRTIRLVPTTLRLPGLCGAWISTTSEDLVFYETDTTAYHRRHIVLHEFGHMLCEHQGVANGYLGLARKLAPAIDPKTITRVLGRDVYSDQEEQEAELFAALAMRRAKPAAPLSRRGLSSADAAAIHRISAALRGTPQRPTT